MNRVALLVPCFNAARFVAPFVAMVRAQRQPYDEILFYDDASTDDTVPQLEALGCKVIRGETNHGAAHARNQLLPAATADYIHFHDIDDELDRDFVAALLPHVRPDRAAACAFQRRRSDGRIEREDRFRDMPERSPGVAYFINHFLTFNAVIYPRALLQKVGGFDEALRIHEDLHLLLRLAATGLDYFYEDRILTTWQLRRDSTYHSAQPSRIAAGQLECLADLCQRWPMETRRALGPTFLELAWKFHMLDDLPNRQRAASLAASCGARTINDRGSKIRWLSRLFGPALTYRLVRPAHAPGR
jgi:glycosyltransferase involved in cell wall biosynthesis